MGPMFESDLEDNVFRRRLMKEVAPGVPVHFSFYSPSVKVQVMHSAENLPGANGRYVGDAVTIEFVPDVASIGPGEVLRGVHHLYLDRGRIKREMHRNPRRNLLHKPPSKDVIFGVRLEHQI